MLLQAFYCIRSERQLMERIEFDLLFRWFVGPGGDELVAHLSKVWVVSPLEEPSLSVNPMGEDYEENLVMEDVVHVAGFDTCWALSGCRKRRPCRRPIQCRRTMFHRRILS